MSVTLFGIILLGLLFGQQVHLSPIVSGQLILEPDIAKYSYIVSLQEEKPFKGDKFYQHFCGGSLISENWILTAAHCVYEKQPEDVVAVIGATSLLDDDVRKYSIEGFFINNYHPYSLRNDIALAKVNINVKDDQMYQRIISLASMKEITPDHSAFCQILGYGANKYGGKILNNLYKANVLLITNAECVKFLGKIMGPHTGDNRICAIGNGTDACQGDSGGPLICSANGKQFLYGIVSQGLNCGLKDVPSIYVIVDRYLEWIGVTTNLI